MHRPNPSLPTVEQTSALHFGALLKILRLRHNIRQLRVLECLPGWTQTNYSRVESSELAPSFDQLAPIYTALWQAGVVLTAHDRQHFLTLARRRIEVKRTCREVKTDQQWDALRLELSQIDQARSIPEQSGARQERLAERPRLLETRHLVGREDWLTSIITALDGAFPKKLLVLQGPVGIGKSSELHRLASHLLTFESPRRPQIVLCELPTLHQDQVPEQALDVFLATLLAEVGFSGDTMPHTSLTVRRTVALDAIEKLPRPLLLLVDNAESLLDEHGQLAACWKEFLHEFLRRRHHASLVLATPAWPGWFEGERVFVMERQVPTLSAEAGVLLLQRLGLASVAVERLRLVSEKVGGVPLCLEWVAALAQEPLWQESWDESEDDEAIGENGMADPLSRRLMRLLDDAALFGGRIASKLTPLLEHIMQKHLSTEAVAVLNILVLAPIPLDKAALQVICPHPRLLKELSAASLLATYPQRTQVLPMVASIVRGRLSPEQQREGETRLMEAYQRWLHKGKPEMQEVGAIIAELATLYLKHHRLLKAAQHLILHGWISFNYGYASRLARLAEQVLQKVSWHSTIELECAGFAILNILFPFLGKPFDPKKYVNFKRIHECSLASNIVLPVEIVGYLTQLLMEDAMNRKRFKEAEAILGTYLAHLEERGMGYMKQHSSVLNKQAGLLGRWCEYTEEQEDMQRARELREQAIAIYRRGDQLLSSEEEASLNRNIDKKRLATWLTNLSYHLNRIGQFEEALQVIERAIALHQQGYVYVGDLAASYGEKSQILMELGRLDEALEFDDKAMSEIQRCADARNLLSQQEVWIYRVNRGRLYLRLGRLEEAKQLLLEAESHIQLRRDVYRKFARQALIEIKQRQSQTGESQ